MANNNRKCRCCKTYYKPIKAEQLYCSVECEVKILNKSAVASRAAAQKVINGTTKAKSGKRCVFVFRETKILCDSLLEYSCLVYFTENFTVDKLKKCDFSIEYQMNGKIKNYVPDFIVEIGGRKIIVECKDIQKKVKSRRWKKYYEMAIVKKEILKNYAQKNSLEWIWFSPDEMREYRVVYERVKLEKGKKKYKKSLG